jgi:hypothetical protein
MPILLTVPKQYRQKTTHADFSARPCYRFSPLFNGQRALNSDPNPFHPVSISFDQQYISDLRNLASCRLTAILGCSDQQFNGRDQGSDLFLSGNAYFLQFYM